MARGETYEQFVEKFKPKKTTDDCYTPPLVYDAIKRWACEQYDIDPARIVRPFYPGGDYERFDYPDGCVVLDNPPFSIASKIYEFYLERGISFFLFCPTLTAFGGKKTIKHMTRLICGAGIEYENGAVIKTSFATNMDGAVVAKTVPGLHRVICEAVETLRRETVRSLPRYEYPPQVLTAAMMQKYCGYGVDFAVMRDECEPVPALDAQRKIGKTIFGAGLLLSDTAAARHKAAERAAAERAAAERAAAERAAAHVWELSAREKEIVRALDK